MGYNSHMSFGWIRRQRGALAVGLAVTLVVAVLHYLDVFRRIEWVFLDFHFRRLNRVEASPRIVHVDIDDAALDHVGAWPWPRDLQADMVRVLHELDAGSIVLDLVFSEPRPPELRLPEFTRFASIEGRVERIGQISAENQIFPDDELAAAIRESRNVYLAMFYKPEPPLTPAERRAVELFRTEVDMAADEAARRLGCSPLELDGLAPFRLRRLAIEQRVAGCLATRPAASAREVHDALRAAPFDVYDPIREAILWSYMRVRSAQEVERRSPPVPSGLAGRLPAISNLTPPLFGFTRGAKAEGFVCFEPDADGTLRHLPLMVEYRGRLLKQLAFAVLCDTLGIRDDDMAIDQGGILTIRAAGDRPAMRVPLDSGGRVLLNWSRAGPSWANCFTHVPGAKLLEICDLRRRSRENETARRIHLARAIRLVKDDAGFEAYRRDVDRYLAERRDLHWAELEGRSAAPEVVALRSRVEEQGRRIEADQAAVVQLIRETWDQLKGLDPADPAIAAEYRRFREAHEILTETCPRLEAANAGIEARVRSLREALRPLVAGRICLVGYTATAVADMVDTPAFARLPGVMVHSNLLNTFLQRSFYGWSRPWERAFIILAVGALVTVFSASRGPRVSFALMVLTMLALAAVNLLALAAGRHFWLASFVGVGLAFVVWAMVVMFRFLVSEREKRRFGKALAQYTSPAIARRIAEDVGRLDLSPVASEVTCFFSDLADFTTLSEQHLDPAKTRSVLNPYLETMSAVLNARSGLINKFMGDGIFAFFNSPVYPCREHARQACEAAIDSQRALRELIEGRRNSPLAGVFGQLRMRIGIASGPVYVGDYGSENKLDYTCMGDTVNLAARLEPANKVFGTSILVSGPTRKAAGDGLVFRQLGSLQVKGKKIAVGVYELLGRAADVPAEAVEYAARFAAAVDLFQSRRWEEASRAFASLLERRDDRAARRYMELAAGYRAAPPPDDWNGAIELTEK